MSGVLGGLIAAFPTPVTGAFESIATYLGDDTASTFTFSSIPQTYKSLHIRVLGRDTYAGTGLNAFKMQPNSDATSGYSHHKLEGEGTAASSSGNTSPSLKFAQFVEPANNEPANTFGVGIMDIIDYANTSKNKTMRYITGYDSGSGLVTIRLLSSAIYNTAAITSLKFTTNIGNFATGTSIALYGIKGE